MGSLSSSSSDIHSSSVSDHHLLPAPAPRASLSLASSGSSPSTGTFKATKEMVNDKEEWFLKREGGKDLVATGYETKEDYEKLATLLNGIIVERQKDEKDYFKLDSMTHVIRVDLDVASEIPSAKITKIFKKTVAGTTPPEESVNLQLTSTFKTTHASALSTFRSMSRPSSEPKAAASLDAGESKRAGESKDAAEKDAKAKAGTENTERNTKTRTEKEEKEDGPAGATTRTANFESLHTLAQRVGSKIPTRIPYHLHAKILSPVQAIARKDLHDQNGALIAKEKIERVPGLSNTSAHAQSNIKRLRAELEMPLSRDIQAKKTRELEYYEAQEKNAEEYMKENTINFKGTPHKKNWVDANYSRDLCLEHGFDEAVNLYGAHLVNARVQTQECDGQTQKLTRLGILNDERNGWFSIKFLKELNPEHADFDDKLYEKSNEVLNKIKGPWYKKGLPKKIKEPDDIKTSIVVLEQRINECKIKLNSALGKDNFKIRYKINNLQSAKYALNKLYQIISNPDVELPKAITDRQQVLQDKALQLLLLQIKEFPDKLKNNGFNIASLSLVNAEHAKLESGIMRNERTAMEDMSGAYDLLNGKTITFKEGLDAAYIEGDKIFVPATLRPNRKDDEGEQKVAGEEQGYKVRAIAINICAQRDGIIFSSHPGTIYAHTRNEGAQLAINEHAQRNLAAIIREMAADDPELLNMVRLNKILMEYNQAQAAGGYDRAAECGKNLMEAGFATSVECASGKDRTGGTVALILHNFLAESKAGNAASADHIAKLRNSILDKDSLHARIIEENTFVTEPKVNTLDLFSWRSRNALPWGIKIKAKFLWGNAYQKRWNKKMFELIEQSQRRAGAATRPLRQSHRVHPIASPPSPVPAGETAGNS